MKKIVLILVAGLMALALTGCGNGQATSQDAVDELANPWEDFDSLEAAEEAAGFEIEIPSGIGSITDYRVCAALNEIEIKFDGGYLRKAKDTGDISGDYNEYAEEREEDMDGVKVTLKGNETDSYNLATWTIDEYSFCIGFTDGVTADEMMSCAKELK